MSEYDANRMEIEIDLKDLFFHLLYRWRSILLVALAGMVALAFWQNHKIESIHAEGEKTTEEEAWELEVEEYHNSLETAQNVVTTNKQQIADQQTYLKNSIYLNLDSENEWTGRKVWYLQSTPEALETVPEGSQIDPTDYALNSYSALITANLSSEDRLALFGTDRWEYIWEVFSASSNAGANTITVSMRSDSEDKVEEVLNYFTKRLDEVCEPQAQLISPHTRTEMMTQIQQESSKVTRSYNDRQMTRSAEVQARQAEIDNWQKQISEAQTKINKLIRDEEPKEPGKHIIRYAAIGLIVGGILMVILYAALYVLGGRVHTGENLVMTFRTGLYGVMPHFRARRHGKGIDGLIEKWEFHHRELDTGKIYDSIAVLIDQNMTGDRLLLAGSLPAEKLEEVRKALSARLPQEIEIDTAPDILRSAEAVQKAGSAKTVTLVEEKEVSRMADMQRLQEMIRISDIPVKGCIML